MRIFEGAEGGEVGDEKGGEEGCKRQLEEDGEDRGSQ